MLRVENMRKLLLASSLFERVDQSAMSSPFELCQNSRKHQAIEGCFKAHYAIMEYSKMAYSMKKCYMPNDTKYCANG